MTRARLCLIAAATMLSACAKSEPPGKELMAAAGCFACHRIGAVGGDSGPDLTFVGLRRSQEWMDLWLKDPRGWKNDAMMPDARLSPEVRAAMADYLASLKGEAYAPGARPGEGVADPVAQGRRIYDKAGCVACHGVRGRGGEPNNNVPGGKIVALSAVIATYTPEELRNRIRYGMTANKADPAGPDPLVSMPPWSGTLTDEEIAAVAAYLVTIAEPAEEGW